MLDENSIAEQLRARGITPDAAQRDAIAALVSLLRHRRRWPASAPARLGVYLHGLPGRGKSMVVDQMFALSPLPKLRLHFHEFLRDVNRRLVTARGDDPYALVAQQWLEGIELLCFDEFHVHDIADAFLVGRFLEAAVRKGVRIVLTSNYAPEKLLPDPRIHHRFQPAIALIQRHFAVIHFNGGADYRFAGTAPPQPRFFTPLGAAADQALARCFRDGGGADDPGAVRRTPVSLAERPLKVIAQDARLLWVEFDELCAARRSHHDYLALCERWEGVLVADLRTRRLREPDTLQRFIWLVDILYDRKRRLYLSSDQKIESALVTIDGVHDLSRTVSRLAEMQSAGYPHHNHTMLLTEEQQCRLSASKSGDSPAAGKKNTWWPSFMARSKVR
jgi:cell division protein ZapE